MPSWWLLAALLLLAGLAAYAAWLWTRVWLHSRQQRQLRLARNRQLLDSIRTIAWAAEQQQCELAEAAVRLRVLLDLLQLSPPLDVAGRFPAVDGLYQQLKQQPSHEARRALAKPERMRLDLQLMQAEARWAEALQPELRQLSQFTVEMS